VEVFWRCRKRPGHPLVYHAIYAYGRLKEETILVKECDMVTPYPWLVSEKFEKWMKAGIKFHKG